MRLLPTASPAARPLEGRILPVGRVAPGRPPRRRRGPLVLAALVALLASSIAQSASVAQAGQAARTTQATQFGHTGGPADIAAAQRALDAWQLEDALQQATASLRARPDAAEAQLLAAEVLHQRGQHQTALALTDTLLAQAGAGAEADAAQRLPPAQAARLASLLPPLRAAAAASRAFVCRETAHFRLCAADKDAIVVHDAEPVLEATYAAVGKALQFAPAERGEKIAVEFYANAAELAGATGLTVREIETSGTIAVCRFHRLMVLSPLATQFGYAWADTLAHEFVHLVISKKSHNRVPVWLHEGLAKTLETAWRDVRPAPLGPWPEKLLSHAVRQGQLVPLARMHPSMAKLRSQQEAALAFAEVTSLVAYVRERYGFARLVDLLAALAANVPFDAALATHLAPLATLERDWQAWLRRRYPQPTHADAVAPTPLQLRGGASRGADRGAAEAAGPDGAAPRAALPPPTDAIADPNVRAQARLGELLYLRGHARAAARAFAAAAHQAKAPVAQLDYRLARALADAGERPQALAVLRRALRRPDEAEAEADRALDARLLLAELELEAARPAAALPLLVAYNRHNPFNPAARTLLGQVHAALGDAEAAAREAAFARLAAAPRPPAARPASPPPDWGRLRVLPPTWAARALDGGPVQPMPAWDLPLPPGRHCVAAPAGVAATATPPARSCVEVPAGAAVTLRP